MFQRFMVFCERYSFGVCTYLGDKFQISSTRIRLFFIYTSFLAVGFPLIFYFLAAFTLDIRNYIKRVRMRYWEM